MTTLQAIPSGPAKCIRGVWSRQKEMPVIPTGVAAGQPHWAQPGLVANDTMSQAMLHSTDTTLWHWEMTREPHRADCQGSLRLYCITLHGKTPIENFTVLFLELTDLPKKRRRKESSFLLRWLSICPLGFGKSQLLPKSDRKFN